MDVNERVNFALFFGIFVILCKITKTGDIFFLRITLFDILLPVLITLPVYFFLVSKS